MKVQLNLSNDEKYQFKNETIRFKDFYMSIFSSLKLIIRPSSLSLHAFPTCLKFRLAHNCVKFLF